MVKIEWQGRDGYTTIISLNMRRIRRVSADILKFAIVIGLFLVASRIY